MNSFKKREALASLGKASMELVEFLGAGKPLDIDEQTFIENHLLLIQLAYCNWKYGPHEQSNEADEADARKRAA